MKAFLQVLLAFLVVILMLGPIGHIGLTHNFVPNLAVISCFAYAWFGQRSDAWKIAVLIGLPLDLLLFLPVGIWTLSLLAVVSVIVYIKDRFLTVSSILQAMITLFTATTLESLLIGLVNGTFMPLNALSTALVNVAIGLVVFSVIGTRFRLFQRWAGRRI